MATSTDTKSKEGTPANSPREAKPVGEWSNGVTDCTTDCAYCVPAFFMPCWGYGRNKQLMGESWWNACCVHCLGCFTGICICIACSNRTTVRDPLLVRVPACRGQLMSIAWEYFLQIRARFNIPGTKTNDCLLHTFCTCCALVQEHQHLSKNPFRSVYVAIAIRFRPTTRLDLTLLSCFHNGQYDRRHRCAGSHRR